MPHALPLQAECRVIAVGSQGVDKPAQWELAIAGKHVGIALTNAGRGGAVLEVNVDDVFLEIGPGLTRRLATPAPGMMRVPEDLAGRRRGDKGPERGGLGGRIMGFGGEVDGKAAALPFACPPAERCNCLIDL